MEQPTHPAGAEKKHTLPWWGGVLALALVLGFIVLMGLSMKQHGNQTLSIGQTIPSFSLTTFTHETISSDKFIGKVVVIHFWASWCGPCELEAEEFEKAYEIYQNNPQVVFMGVDYVDTESEAQKFLAKYQIRYANAPDLGSKVSQMFHISGVPETYILDRSGRLAFEQIGPFGSAAELQAQVDQLLK
jgi:cytochrome c biogenesis protein CcmG, thiol:disulfide interchange protein DsbE